MRWSVVKLIVEQKAEKARVEAERRSAIKLSTGQKYEKARVEAKRRSTIKKEKIQEIPCINGILKGILSSIDIQPYNMGGVEAVGLVTKQ